MARLKNFPEIEEKKDDLEIKMGTKERIVWEKVAKEAMILIEQSEENLLIQRAMLKLADKRIEEEKHKI